MNDTNLNNSNEEIDLKELFFALWDKKFLIIFLTTIAAIISVFYALSLPNIYSSDTLLAPTDSEQSMGGSIRDYSSIASMAGINIPSQSGGKTAEAIERIKSYDFFVNHFLPNIQFKDLVAAKSWSAINNTMEYYPDASNNLIKKTTNQQAYKIYTSILDVSLDKKTTFVSMKIEHISPHVAAKWLNIIIQNINSHMRELDKAVAKNSITFLNLSAQDANLSEVRASIFSLIQNQIQLLTLAEANIDYVFRPISSPIVPEVRSRPSRSSISISGTIAGFIISLFISLMFHFLKLMRVKKF